VAVDVAVEEVLAVAVDSVTMVEETMEAMLEDMEVDLVVMETMLHPETLAAEVVVMVVSNFYHYFTEDIYYIPF
jgi:hypothetical protein